MKRDIDYSLYLVTDRALMRSDTVEASVELAVRGGCTLVQLREKDIPSLDFYDTARNVKAVCTRYGVPLIINDRVDIALAVNADGVHIGQEDLPARVVRSLIGPDKLLGVSVSHPAEALRAERDGADYLGVGAIFATGTKADAATVSLDTLREIRKSTSLPLVAIGGIGRSTLPLLAGTGIDGVAVVSAIVAADDIAAAARELAELLRLVKEKPYA